MVKDVHVVQIEIGALKTLLDNKTICLVFSSL